MNYIYVKPSYYSEKFGKKALAPEGFMGQGTEVAKKVEEIFSREKKSQKILDIFQILAGEYKQQFCMQLSFSVSQTKEEPGMSWYVKADWLVDKNEIWYDCGPGKAMKKINLKDRQVETIARAVIVVSEKEMERRQKEFSEKIKSGKHVYISSNYACGKVASDTIMNKGAMILCKIEELLSQKEIPQIISGSEVRANENREIFSLLFRFCVHPTGKEKELFWCVGAEWQIKKNKIIFNLGSRFENGPAIIKEIELKNDRMDNIIKAFLRINEEQRKMSQKKLDEINRKYK